MRVLTRRKTRIIGVYNGYLTLIKLGLNSIKTFDLSCKNKCDFRHFHIPFYLQDVMEFQFLGTTINPNEFMLVISRNSCINISLIV